MFIRGTTYSAYGLAISSPLPLPELILREAPADVTISLGKVDRSRLESVGERQRFWADADHACYAYDGAGAFSICGGDKIVLDADPRSDPRNVRLCLLGPVLGLVLHQRGRFVLHGSAAAINGGAIAFLGGNGWGKSTLAAACHNQGHRMITDDVLAINVDSETPTILPSYPQFKLWPKSAVALGENLDEMPIVHPDFDKRARRVTEGFSHSPVPTKRFYILGRGSALKIERLSPQEGLKWLLGYWYGRRFGASWLRAIDQGSYFVQSATLVNRVRICRFLRPADLSSLTEQVRLLERDVQSD